MIKRYWKWIKSAALAVLAAFGIWTAWRALDRGAKARNTGELATNVATARTAHARADELEAKAKRKRAEAQARIDAIYSNGERSMAEKLEKMNAL